MKVCKNCLRKIEWSNYHLAYGEEKKDFIRNSFNLEPFFKKYQSSFSEIPKSPHSQKPGYASNHSEIASEYKKAKNWMCEQCNVDLSSHRYLLDLHHISGVKNNNLTTNLKALCKICHRKQPNHQNYNIKSKDEITILAARLEQLVNH